MKYIYTSFIALCLVVAGFWFFSSQPQQAFGTTNVPIYAPVKSTGVLCTTSSTLLVATSTSGRNLITISNDSANAVFLGLGVAAVAYQGTMIPASTTLTFNSNGTYAGAIYCLGLGASASTSVSDSQS